MIRRLTVITGPASGTVYELEDGQVLVIGRGADSDTVIDDGRMSRVHCRVIVDGDLTTVADAGTATVRRRTCSRPASGTRRTSRGASRK